MPNKKCGMPDYSSGTTDTLPYTAPSDGVIKVNMSCVNNGLTYLNVNNVTVGRCGNGNQGAGIAIMCQFDVKQGDIITITGGYQAYEFVFYYLSDKMIIKY